MTAVLKLSLDEILRKGRPAVPVPLALRWDGAERAKAAIRALRFAQGVVRAGGTVMDAIADGTLDGWYARQALGSVLGTVQVPQWDAHPARTKAERIATLKSAVAYLTERHLRSRK